LTQLSAGAIFIISFGSQDQDRDVNKDLRHKAKDWTGKAKAQDTKNFPAKAKDSSVKDKDKAKDSSFKDKAKDLPVMTRTDEDILETCKN